MSRRGALLSTSLVCLTMALCPGASGAETRASLPDIEDEVMCPICGTTLELSEAPQAERERELIRDLIAQGKTKEEIKDALVAEYGSEVLATPEGSGFDLAAWLVPGAGIAIAAALIALALRRRALTAKPEEEALHSVPPDEADRLAKDIARYDL